MRPYKEFYRYVLPSMLAFALSGVYAIADGFFVGNALGDQALAAINIAYPLTALLQAVGTGIGMGGAVRYSISAATEADGEKERYFGCAVLLLTAAGLGLTAGLLALAPPLLEIFGASGEILALGESYLRWIAAGALLQVLGTGVLPFLRNMGCAVAAMAAMMAGFAANILLDYLLVWVLPYGMAGAAVATVTGQAVTLAVCVGCFAAQRRRPMFQAAGTGRMARQILAVGLSPFGLTFSPNITLILVNKSAALVGGDLAVTCYAPVSYISAVALLLFQGISDGCQPLVSRAYGRGDERAAREFRSLSYGFSAAVALVCMGVLFCLRTRAAALFGASGEVTALVAGILPLFLTGYLFTGLSRSATAYFYATEKSLRACALIYGEPLGLLALLLVLPERLGVTGTWLSVPLSQLLIFLLSLVLLR